MRREMRVGVFVASITVLTGISVVLQLRQDTTAPQISSLSHAPLGYSALFALLETLAGEGDMQGRGDAEGEVRRSYAAIQDVPLDRPLWILEPAASALAGGFGPSQIEAWIEAGGTAVVFGGGGSGLGMLDLPTRERERPELSEDERREREQQSREERLRAVLAGQRRAPPTESEQVPLDTYGLVRCPAGCDAPRELDAREIHVFAEPLPDDSDVVVRLDGAPFVVERGLGDGRLVAVADGRPLSNEQLSHVGGSLLATDLLRTYGAPWIDETVHGLGETTTLLDVLGLGRTALLAFATLLLGLAWVLHQRRWPPRELGEPVQPEPTLHAFVYSLASLYGRSRDHAAVFAAYRSGLLRRLGRTATAEARLRARIESDRALDAEARAWLLGQRSPGSIQELTHAVQTLERYTGSSQGGGAA